MGRKMRVEQLTERNTLTQDDSILLTLVVNVSSTTCRKAGWCLRNPITNPHASQDFPLY